jgi:hypothetical protein
MMMSEVTIRNLQSMTTLTTFITVLCTLCVMVISSSDTWAQTPDYSTLFGIVIDDITEENLSGVKLTLIGTAKGAVTDRKGRFLIAQIPPGTYTLKATL